MSSSAPVAPSYLLLLPPTPWPARRESLQATYKPALNTVLKGLSSSSRSKPVGAKLDIAVVVPYLFEQRNAARTILYEEVQALVAGIYKLICVIASKEQINVEDAEGIDARLFLLAHSNSDATNLEDYENQAASSNIGPVITLSTLAKSERPYERIFSVESGICNDILRHLTVSLVKSIEVEKVKGGDAPSDLVSPKDPQNLDNTDIKRHISVAVGGTWDHLHIGHKLLLTMFAFVLDVNDQSDRRHKKTLTIGITGDELLKNKKYAEMVQSWDERQRSVADFLGAIMDFRPRSDDKAERKEVWEEGPNGHVVIISPMSDLEYRHTEISDPFGPTITDEAISALVLSGETRAGGKAVNDKRIEKGWTGLEVLEVDVLDAEEESNDILKDDSSFQSKLSSTSIRKAHAEKSQNKI